MPTYMAAGACRVVCFCHWHQGQSVRCISFLLLPSQSAARRPSAERLLSLPAVRAKAAELGIELPPIQLSPPVAGSPGPAPALGEGRRLTAAHGGKGGIKAAPPAAALPRPLRRASCPDGGPEGGLVQHPPARRVTAQERRKPPLPPAAVPQRRRTVQVGAVAERAPSPPKLPRAAQEAVGAAPAQRLANSLESDDASTVQEPAGAAAPPEAAPAPTQPGQGGGSPVLSPPAEAKPPALKVTHFSVERHMSGMSAAARQWLQQRGGSKGAAPDGVVELEVQRSTKSDSSLLGWSDQRAAAAMAAVEAPAPCMAAAEPAEEPVTDQEVAAPATQLRQRCVALLGSEARCGELLALAKAAASAEQGSGGSGDSGGGSDSGGAGPSMAQLGEAVYSLTGSTGRAGEVMFLLMRLLAAKG